MSERYVYYILDEKRHIRPTTDIMDIERLFSNIDLRRVDLTHVENCEISTVFLCIDHDFTGNGPPVLFETMVFKDGREVTDYPTRRYSTYGEAHKGHWDIVDIVKNDLVEKK